MTKNKSTVITAEELKKMAEANKAADAKRAEKKKSRKEKAQAKKGVRIFGQCGSEY